MLGEQMWTKYIISFLCDVMFYWKKCVCHLLKNVCEAHAHRRLSRICCHLLVMGWIAVILPCASERRREIGQSSPHQFYHFLCADVGEYSLLDLVWCFGVGGCICLVSACVCVEAKDVQPAWRPTLSRAEQKTRSESGIALRAQRGGGASGCGP